MAGPGAGGGGAGLRRFRRLADLTALVTFLLIIVGGVVRVSDSGLGCGPGGSGTKGWPLFGGEHDESGQDETDGGAGEFTRNHFKFL